ncbi:MAG: diphthine synthase [Thermoplasmata archaeon]|nr:diphthine synthase [Thermoplasmata archaeon]
MLTFVGLGLYGTRDITLRGKDAVDKADYVFAEFYTSKLLGASVEDLEKFFGKKITLLSREEVEKGKILIESASKGNTVLLVAGDPMVATTHVSLKILAEERGIKTEVIHNSSIITAAPGMLGLQHYKFGRIVSIPFPQENYFPTSVYDFLAQNMKMGLHTLLLLDINPRPMTANEGMEILLKMEEKKKLGIINGDTLIAVVARAGAPDAAVKAGYMKDMLKENFGPPLHTLVIPGKLHFAEAEALVKLAHAPKDILEE